VAPSKPTAQEAPLFTRQKINDPNPKAWRIFNAKAK
jgi:hypothetical protein